MANNNGRNKKDKKIGRKESEKMDQLVDSLMEELNCKYSIYHSFIWRDRCTGIGGGHMDHYGHYHDRSLIWVHGLKIRKISGKQAALESGFSSL